MRNWLNTLLWIGLTAAAVYALSEWAVLQRATAGPGAAIVMMQKPTNQIVEQDGASGRDLGGISQHARAAAPPPVDVEAAYRATIQKHLARHIDGVNRLDLEFQRLERQLDILKEAKADQDRRFELAVGGRGLAVRAD